MHTPIIEFLGDLLKKANEVLKIYILNKLPYPYEQLFIMPFKANREYFKSDFPFVHRFICIEYLLQIIINAK